MNSTKPMRAAAIALIALVLGWLPPARAMDLDQPLILVARPGVADPVYGSTVLLVAPFGGDQHIGFILNRPTGLTLGKIFPEHAAWQKRSDPVYLGGPVEPWLIFALVQRTASPGGKSLEVMPGLYFAYEGAVLDRIVESEPQHARFIAGLVAWRSGELRAQIELGAWYALEPDTALVMRQPDGLWEELVRRSQRARNTF